MRKGSKRSNWTTEQVAFLVENAGRIPKRDICMHLRKSANAVRHMAARLRAEGIPVELRCFESKLCFCPGCGCLRATAAETGLCEVCYRRGQLEAINAKIAALWPLLTDEQRDVYEQTDAETESRRDPLPKAPHFTPEMSHYRRQQLQESWLSECERVQAANLMREVKAAQKRKERIEKKIRTNGTLPGKAKRYRR